MARLEIRWSGGSAQHPLATATLLGRHACSTWTVPEPRLPLFWLELRWARGWAWRVLAGEDQTRGPGQPLPGGWRRLRIGERIHGPGEASVTLLEDGPPEPFAVDPDSGDLFLGNDLLDVLEERRDGWWPVGAESDLRRLRPLVDGQAFLAAGRLLRFHDGQAPSETVRCALSLDSASCELSLTQEADSDTWRLTLLDGDASVEVTGEMVRALVPYAEVRRLDMPHGGWLELDAAHFRWQQLGGRADSSRDRVGQDRSRLCRQLSRLGVAAAATLFETERRAEGWVTRVTLPRDRLFIDGTLPPMG